MRKILMLIAAMVGILCFSTAVLAEGFTLDGDLMLASPNEEANTDDLGYLTIGAEEDLDPFVVGGTFMVSVYKDPELLPTQEAMTFFYGIYGGYTIVNNDSLKVAGLLGYYAYKNDFTDAGPIEINWSASSIVAGFKASFDADPFSVSLLYLYGISPESTTETNFAGNREHTDPGLSFLELKGTYAFNDAWSIQAAYRIFSVDAMLFDTGFYAEDAGSSGFGVGVTYKF